jgi:AcrR family transcriptional regulator
MALAAAREIVAQGGLKGLSARKVAARIGYTVGTLYLVFRNLEELTLRMNALTLDELYALLESETAAQQQPQRRVLALAYAYAAFAQQNPHLWRAVFDLRLADGQILPDWFQARIDRSFELVTRVVNEALEGAPISKARLAATALWSGIHGICILAHSGKLDLTEAISPEVMIESLVTNYLAGLAVSQSAER